MLTVAELRVTQRQLYRATATEFIDLQMEGRVDIIALDKPQPACARAKPDGRKAHTVLNQRHAHMTVAGNRRNVLDDHVFHTEYRLRIAHAVRLKSGKPLNLLYRQPIRPHHAVDVQLRHQLGHRDMRLGVGAQAVTQRVNVAHVHSQPCGERVPTVALEQIFARGQRVEQVKAANRTPRAFACAVLIQRNQHNRTAVPVAQARTHDTDHAMVPTLTCQHNDFILNRVVFSAQACERLLQNLIFLVLP